MNREKKNENMIKSISGPIPVQIHLPVRSVDGRSYQQGRGAATGTIAPTACTVSIWIMSQVTAVRTATGGWSPSASGYGKTASGQSSTDAVPAERSYQTALPPTIIR